MKPEDAAGTPSPENHVSISLRNISKAYRLYKDPRDRLKQALWRGRRQFYQEFWALWDVSLEVRRGETLAIIGRNGSGKSTLLQIVCGTLEATSGEMRVGGRLSALLELGAGFNPEFTGRENVYVSAALLGLSREQTDALFDDIAAFADIGEFIERPVKTYSSGMYVRLAFAVAISVTPEILVVDEALAVGDIFFQQKCMRHMRESLAGATKLLVTHDMHAVTSLADRVMVLDKGRAVFEGPPLEAVEHFTRLVHDEEFRVEKAVNGVNGADAPASREATVDEHLPWVETPGDSQGGAGEVVIERWATTGEDGGPISAVQGGERVDVHMVVFAATPKEDVLFGYNVNDRTGKPIFGENTYSVSGGIVPMPRAGRYLVRFSFAWPEIQPGDYTITLGIGQGSHPLNHVIQCWAHNVKSFSAISPAKAVHCIFNNPITEFGVTSVE
jgi:ABC-type polysaccharide/polyol phosphate transport system ATPase subunit